MKKNAFYAQSGGVTSVINASASAVISEAMKSTKIGKVYAGKNGILGALREELIDTSKESKKFIESLKYIRQRGYLCLTHCQLHTDQQTANLILRSLLSSPRQAHEVDQTLEDKIVYHFQSLDAPFQQVFVQGRP